MVKIAYLLSAAVLFVASAGPARADEDKAVSETKQVLHTLEHETSAAALEQAATDLTKHSADSVEALAAFLERPHQATDEERRAVLAAVGADVPDERGRFRNPGRQSDEEKKHNDELDWLPELLELPASMPGRGEVVADVAVIRALAASRQTEAGRVILDFAFTDTGMVYRDECGRYLRKMAPYSLPALIVASQSRHKSPSKARYSTYQLERMDRQNANKAMAAADPDLKVKILRAYAESQFREAVYTVLDYTDNINPKVRAAARAAWHEYVAGKPPREAPKRKLVMTGGKLSDEEEPLWLDSRELADIEIRRRLKAITGEDPAAKATPVDMSKQLFAYYDEQRRKKLDDLFEKGKALAADQEVKKAAELFDRVLAQDPDYQRRTDMAQVYFDLGQALQKEKDFRGASTAFAKTQAVDPKGPLADRALAAHHVNRAKMQGDSGKVELARAKEIAPEAAPARAPRWMLMAGAGVVGLGLLLLLTTVVRRRA